MMKAGAVAALDGRRRRSAKSFPTYLVDPED